MKPIENIDDVILTLNLIIEESLKTGDTLGYFAVLYQKVTVKVKEEIKNNYFDDGPRMAKLDVVFAKRYIDAYFAWMNNEPVTQSWEIAFTAASNNNLLVVQHLLLGMNAHINLDLGIAAAEISSTNSIEELEDDFNRINEILASMVDEVQQGLSSIWPFLRKLLLWLGQVDNLLVDFSMKIARKGAWKYAKEVAAVEKTGWPKTIKIRDEKVADKTRLITDPGKIIRFLFQIIRWTERGTVSDKIQKLRR
ncbi:DUF5995 family protein [Draconibacterium halophilum]|uniref:Uncharacterized protein n=1 Tax=Draconibacterium halophilum TaxID=2706887 RepID=A0A6C0RB22_9BACT|nr:DUF5995 family protein [Draconibacterium halophilum]QIA07624.1 hypothetical protein G0Q07_07745 [Draconibacterium halophilum]